MTPSPPIHTGSGNEKTRQKCSDGDSSTRSDGSFLVSLKAFSDRKRAVVSLIESFIQKRNQCTLEYYRKLDDLNSLMVQNFNLVSSVKSTKSGGAVFPGPSSNPALLESFYQSLFHGLLVSMYEHDKNCISSTLSNMKMFERLINAQESVDSQQKYAHLLSSLSSLLYHKQMQTLKISEVSC